ncbi:MAG: deoxyguanosinetriphosphate triphosphohydrolase [Turneriella sp.]|nr:deoxyguanosinetriphosphate triphosphohydrolase [Turneriella sp.]
MPSTLAAQGQYFESRVFPEESHALRNEFQRDRDRVVHSKYFRRLEYKTQVFVNHLGDNFRTRLTHSIEVAQIARTVARVLGLNEDLTETVALAHDMGHPPFGHAGERALHERMKAHGGFDHNEQTLRIVTVLEERYPAFAGLNLTQGTIASLQKHASLPQGLATGDKAPTGQPAAPPDVAAAGRAHSVPRGHAFEALIVDICDEIAYNNHDIDDGLESGFLRLEQLDETDIWRENFAMIQKKYPDTKEKIQIRATIRELINGMVGDLIQTSKKNLADSGLKSFGEVLAYNGDPQKPPLIAFSPTMDERVKQLKKFLFHNLYRHAEVVRMNERAAHIIHRIFDFITADPKMLPADFYERIATAGLERVIADFVAGMTDRYALQWNSDILGTNG